jgi:peroxiredoxin
MFDLFSAPKGPQRYKSAVAAPILAPRVRARPGRRTNQLADSDPNKEALVRPDIRAGANFPDYELPDHEGSFRRLSELQGSSPLVLHLSRGGFDPKEHRFLRQLVDAYPDFRVGYTRLVVISTDNQLEINEFRDSLGAEWPFLSDPERTIQRDLDIKEYTDPVHDPMIPHTLVLEPGLRVFKVYNGYWYWGRPSVGELRLDLRALLRKVRPDFDLGAPGLREAWDRGEREMFLVEPAVGTAIRYTEGTGVKRP